MASTGRFDASRATTLGRIAAAWEKDGRSQLAELLAAALGQPELLKDRRGVRFDNERIAAALEWYVLKGEPPTSV